MPPKKSGRQTPTASGGGQDTTQEFIRSLGQPMDPIAKKALNNSKAVTKKLGGNDADLDAVSNARMFDQYGTKIVKTRPRLTPLQQMIYQQTHGIEVQTNQAYKKPTPAPPAPKARVASPVPSPVKPAPAVKPPTRRVYPPGTPTSPQSPNVTITEVKRAPYPQPKGTTNGKMRGR